MHENEDTQAFLPLWDDENYPSGYTTLSPAVPDAPWVKFTAAGEPENEIEEQLPKPAIVRVVLVTGASLVGAIFGKQFNVAWVDAALDLYILAAPLALGYWVHRKVKATPSTEYVGKHRAT